MIDKFEEPLGPQGRLFEQELHQDLHQFLQSMKECFLFDSHAWKKVKARLEE